MKRVLLLVLLFHLGQRSTCGAESLTFYANFHSARMITNPVLWAEVPRRFIPDTQLVGQIVVDTMVYAVYYFADKRLTARDSLRLCWFDLPAKSQSDTLRTTVGSLRTAPLVNVRLGRALMEVRP